MHVTGRGETEERAPRGMRPTGAGGKVELGHVVKISVFLGNKDPNRKTRQLSINRTPYCVADYGMQDFLKLMSIYMS